LREKYCWLIAGDWFVLREKYCCLVADKPNEQDVDPCLTGVFAGRREYELGVNVDKEQTFYSVARI
jgi:hypothetical protein